MPQDGCAGDEERVRRLTPYESMRKAGEWEKLGPFERPDVEKMLVGIEVMPSQQDVLDGFSMIPARRREVYSKSRGVTAFG
jgi:hypothetical protein